MSFYSGNLQQPMKAARIRVRIWGLDSDGRAFSETVETRSVGRERAEIEGVRVPLKAGEVIGLGNGDLKARFSILSVAKKPTGDSLLEVQMVAPAKGDFWGVKHEEPPQAARVHERRSSPRYRCVGFAVLHLPNQNFVVRAPVTDIALNGCYVELAMPYPLEFKLDLEVTVRDACMKCPAQVVSSHPGVGMGLRFDSQRLVGADQLSRLLLELDREVASKQGR
jgi:hypothetical protein